MICYYYEAPLYLVFANDVPQLLYYSHLPVMIVSLLVGMFVFLNARHSLTNKLLLTISVCFSIWTFFNLILWTNIYSDTLLFIWSFMGPLQALISILSVYLTYVFVTKRDISKRVKAILLILLAPVLVFAPTNLALRGFDLAWCDAFKYEGQLYIAYYNLLGLLAIIWIAVLLFKYYRKSDSVFKKQILFYGIGIEAFLILFFTLVYLAGLFTNLGWFDSSWLETYSLFGMAFFMVILGVLIVKFNSFNIKVHAAEALTFALIILIASQYTYANSTTATIVLTSVTLVLTAAAGLYLNRSVRSEIKQRKEIEDLAKKLAKANKRLRKLDKAKSEFVSIASHQLRSPIAAMRGYTSMLLEGSYGQLPQKAKDVLERIADSAKNMALSIEDYLNVSRIESGNMKYELADFNLNDEAKLVVDDKRQEAIKNGLVLTYKSDLTRNGIVNADRGKVVQILHNLINNSIKYTEQGSITVYVHNTGDNNTINVDIIDTGVGMNEDELDSIFGKFERAAGANAVNVSGTGLGLFVAKSMAEHMGGTITALSDGKGKGSTFRLSLPLAA